MTNATAFRTVKANGKATVAITLPDGGLIMAGGNRASSCKFAVIYKGNWGWRLAGLRSVPAATFYGFTALSLPIVDAPAGG